MTAHPSALAALPDPVTPGGRPVLTVVDPVELPPPPHSKLVWHRTLELAETFEQRHLFMVVLDVLRAARYDVATMTYALALGHSHLADHRGDLVAWRAAGLLGQAIAFLGGQEPQAP